MNIILFEEFELGRNLPRRDERTIHLLKVLHKKEGDVFDAGIIGGMRGTGKIEKINFDGSVFVSIHADEPPPAKMFLRVLVAFARPIQLKRIFRDLSCMGVPDIDLIGTDLGEKSYRDTKMIYDGGARTAFLEGAVQARDTLLPVLTVYENLDKWLNERPWEKSGSKRTPFLLVMDNVHAEGSLFHISMTSRPFVTAIGPERGWSNRERELFQKAGFMRLSIGDRPLRTETACIAAVTLVMEKMEDVSL